MKPKEEYSDDHVETLLDMIFSPLRGPVSIWDGGRVPRSLNEALRRGLVPRALMAQAYRIVDSYPYPRRPATAIPARSEYNNPGWDDVVRAYEEDR